MDGIAYLRRPVYEYDELGQQVAKTYEETQIFVSEESVSRAEFFEAGQSGFNPQIVLTTASVNYDGQPEAKYNGRVYGIYRTYYKAESDQLELYLEQKAGALDGE